MRATQTGATPKTVGPKQQQGRTETLAPYSLSDIATPIVREDDCLSQEDYQGGRHLPYPVEEEESDGQLDVCRSSPLPVQQLYAPNHLEQSRSFSWFPLTRMLSGREGL